MTLQGRDKRALLILAGAVVLVLILRFGFSRDGQTKVVGATDSIPVAEKRLARLRLLAAGVPAKDETLKRVSAEVAERERGMIQAETAAQVQAQLLQILRRIAKAQAPAIEIGTVEIGQVRALGQDYGEVLVPVSFECRIEQLVNYLADLTAQPELLATIEMRIASSKPKEKMMTVRLTVSGVVPRRLVPGKKGLVSF